MTNNVTGLADFFKFKLPAKGKQKHVRLNGYIKYRTNLGDLSRPQTSKISFVARSCFAEIAGKNIHLSTDSLCFYSVALQEDCFLAFKGGYF